MSAWSEYKVKNPNLIKPIINQLSDPRSIFVAIPAFEEEDLYQTVEDCFKKAANPEKIFVGIANQKVGSNFEDFSKFPNVRVVNTSSEFYFGLGLSFAIAMALYDYEDFFLRIDAHSRFENNWDLILKKNYDIIKNDGYEKPIISYRNPWFEKNEDGSLNFKEYTNVPDIRSFKRELIDVLPRRENISLETEYEHAPIETWENINYKEHYFIAGGLCFAAGGFIKDVFADPRIIFYGEEHTMPMRAYGNGYKIFAIKEQSVMTMGKTKQYYENIGSNNWKNLISKGKLKYSFLHKHFTDHYKLILKGEELGYFGAKDEKAYTDYIEALGINYKDIL